MDRQQMQSPSRAQFHTRCSGGGACAPAAGARRMAPARRGNIIVVMLLLILLVEAVGLTMSQLASRDQRSAFYDWEQEQAMNAADAGMDYAIWWLGNSGSTSSTLTRTMPGSQATFTITFTTGVSRYSNEDVIQSVGTSSDGSQSVTVHGVSSPINIGVNVFPWANALFCGGTKDSTKPTGKPGIHGSIHILAESEPYDSGAHTPSSVVYPITNDWGFTTSPVGGARSAQPFYDVNMTGSYASGITSSTEASNFTGSTAVLNNYEGVNASTPTGWVSNASTSTDGKLPPLSQTSSGLNTMNAQVRVEHGYITLQTNTWMGQGAAGTGIPAAYGNPVLSSSDKGTVDDSYVDGGYSFHNSAVFSDNGISNGYDLTPGTVHFPDVIKPVLENGVSYTSWLDYLKTLSDCVQYTPSGGTLNLTSSSVTIGNNNPIGNPSAGPGLVYTVSGSTETLQIYGIIYVHGAVTLGQGSNTITYQGVGTIVASGEASGSSAVTYNASENCYTIAAPENISVADNLIAYGTYGITSTTTHQGFPGDDGSGNAVNCLGLLATDDINITNSSASGGLVMGELFAEAGLISNQVTTFAGSIVTNYFQLNNTFQIYYVPLCATGNHLPPGLPGTTAIYSGGSEPAKLSDYYIGGS